MPVNVSLSILLCTRNRAEKLKQMLAALGQVRIPAGWKAEVIVVDNASTDDTATVVRNTKLGNLETRYVLESKSGKSRALNTGLAHARGDYILFTDDDVLVAEDWVERMMSRLREGGCHAVTGQITLAPNLNRPWLSSAHRRFLASSQEAKEHNGARELIGANMGLRRSVLERVAQFDFELGPGALGLGEDTLFGWQVIEAGFKIDYAPEVAVIHQLEESRLKRANWLGEARKHGRTEAYLLHHWEHGAIRAPRVEWFWYWVKLQLRRRLQPPPPLDSEGCPLWEMSYVLHLEKCEQFCRERLRPRNYTRRGLLKRSSPEYAPG